MKTIAILADTGKFSPEFLQALAKHNFRLLIVCEDEKKILQYKNILGSYKISEDLEFIHCEREGCWEADLICIHEPENFSPALISKIKEVATQKIVLVISEDGEQSKPVNFSEILPNSKVVIIHSQAGSNEISGKDTEAKTEVKELFKGSDYLIN